MDNFNQQPDFFKPVQKDKIVEPKQWDSSEKKESIFLLASKYKKYFSRGGLLLIAVVLIIAGLLFWYGLTSFDKDKVELQIKGPERAASGEEITYTIEYQNKNRTDLRDIKLTFYYPQGAIPLNGNNLVETINLPDLPAKKTGDYKLKAKLIGFINETKTARAQLNYQAGRITSRFTNEASFSTTIFAVPLVLDFDLPEKLVNEQSVSFSLRYINQSSASFDNLRLQIEYPDGFVFESSDPEPLERNNVWPIGTLLAGEQGRIFIQGVIKGEEGQIKSFRAQLGLFKDEQFTAYTETFSPVQISISPLFISQIVNNSADYITQAGETLAYQLTYKNTTDTGIREVVISSQLEGEALDFASLKLDGGSFDGAKQMIVWKASNLSDLAYLAPHQEGKLNFSIKVKKPLPIKNYTNKNFTITNTAKIYSSKVPLPLERLELSSENKLITKIASQLTIDTKGYYHDDLISNSGPIPPRVGQRTTYTIKWQLVNTANDLTGVKAEAFLPPHVEWLNNINPAMSDLDYNPQTGQLVWQVGSLPAGTGIILPAKWVAFQVAITPGLMHVGGLMELIGQSTATGYDDFVGLDLRGTDTAIDTNLPDDQSIGYNGGVVSQ